MVGDVRHSRPTAALSHSAHERRTSTQTTPTGRTDVLRPRPADEHHDAGQSRVGRRGRQGQRRLGGGQYCRRTVASSPSAPRRRTSTRATTTRFRDVFVRDLQTNTTTLVSRGSGAAGAKGSNSSLVPAISADGRYVAFYSFASNLDPDDTDTSTDVFVRDLQASTTTLVSRASGAAGAKGNGASRVPVISPGGRFVAFDSNASNLHPDDTDATGDAFVRDLQAGTTTLISRASGADGAKGNDDSLRPVISADWRFVAFDSTASNLDPADTDTTADVYMRDVQANTTTLVSRASGPAGAKGNFFSLGPAMSRDGRFVGFVSGASNLDPADTDFSWDVFVRDVLGPPPPPTPAPPPSATPSRPASAVMRLRVLGVSVLGRTGARARCVMRTGRVRSCNVRLLRGRRLVARGRAAGAPATRRTVELRLTRYGRALLTRRLGGVRVRARATGATSAGLRHAGARSRALLAVEHATTPPGAWQPDRAALTARGRRFLRRVRGRLIAVSALRCHGYTGQAPCRRPRRAHAQPPACRADLRGARPRPPTRGSQGLRPRRRQTDRRQPHRRRPRAQPARRDHHRPPPPPPMTKQCVSEAWASTRSPDSCGTRVSPAPRRPAATPIILPCLQHRTWP